MRNIKITHVGIIHADIFNPPQKKTTTTTTKKQYTIPTPNLEL